MECSGCLSYEMIRFHVSIDLVPSTRKIMHLYASTMMEFLIMLVGVKRIFLKTFTRLSVSNSYMILNYWKNFPMLVRKLLMLTNPNSLSSGTVCGNHEGLT